MMAISLFVSLTLLQLVKRMLGIPLYAPETAEWTSADTLHHYAGEKVDPQQGQWRRPVWPGSLSGRGQSQYETWRHGDRNSR